jgi:hypothetical protein
VADVDAAIRARLASFSNEACLGGCGCEDNRCNVQGFDEMRDALIAVLGQHKPMEGLTADVPVCTCLPDCDDTYVAHDYPCSTVRDIAKALGVEVP